MVAVGLRPTEAMGTTLDCKICKQSFAARADKNHYHRYMISNLECGKITQRDHPKS